MDKSPKMGWRRFLPKRLRGGEAVVHWVRLSGAIGDASQLRSSLALHKVNDTLERAFAKKGIKGVAISINSPGGSPVQSELIHDRIRQLAKKHDLPVWTFCEDVAASGGYWLATAGDEIYASENSIIGSIGVVGGMFGFVDLMKKIGLERRVYTAGENKVQLDPFLPEKQEDVERLKKLQTEIHESFIGQVRSRRGTKLDENNPELFSGAYWTGQTALSLGLVDALGDPYSVLADKFGDDVKIRPVMPKTGFSIGRLFGRGDAFGSLQRSGWGEHLVDEAIAGLDQKMLWHRYGL